MTALSHNHVRPLPRAVGDTEASTKEIGDALSAEVTGGNSLSILISRENEKRTGQAQRFTHYRAEVEESELPNKEIQLFRRAIRLVFCDSTQPFDNPLNAMPDCNGGVPVVAGQFRARGTFQLEPRQEIALFALEEPFALASVEKLLQHNFGVLVGNSQIKFNPSFRRRCQIVLEPVTRLTNRPTESATANLSRDRECKVRSAITQFLGIEEFEGDRKDVLCDVVAREAGKTRGNLAGSAVNGRNEDQQEELLSDGAKSDVISSVQYIKDKLVGQRTPVLGAVVVKLPDERKRRRGR